jgi:hypothetical protein
MSLNASRMPRCRDIEPNRLQRLCETAPARARQLRSDWVDPLFVTVARGPAWGLRRNGRSEAQYSLHVCAPLLGPLLVLRCLARI